MIPRTDWESKMKNKKVFGKDIGTVITFLLCLAAAVLFWLFVKYCDRYNVDDLPAIASMLRGNL